MDATSKAYEDLIQRFVAWAERQENIRGAVVVGSRARLNHPADEWADLDIIIVARDPQKVWEADSWISQIGPVRITFFEPTPGGTMERRVLFEGGLDVDFAPVPVAAIQAMAEMDAPPDAVDLIKRGGRILVDKDGLLEKIQPENLPAYTPPPPTQAEFDNLTGDFWYHAVWCAKHLMRGELWWAKGGVDSHMKNLLRIMLEWHARGTRGPNHDTWFRGRFLEEWADPRAVAELPNCFAHYEKSDVWNSLIATMNVFSWVSRETAQAFQLSYPDLAEEKATQIVQQLVRQVNQQDEKPEIIGRSR